MDGTRSEEAARAHAQAQVCEGSERGCSHATGFDSDRSRLGEHHERAPDRQHSGTPEQRQPSKLDIAAEIQRRGWVQVRGALEPSVVAALCDELSDELCDPSVPPESGTPRVTLSDTSTWPTGGARRVIEAVPTRGSTGTGCCERSQAWDALVTSPALVEALDLLLGEGCWELPLNEPYHGGVIGSEYVRHWYAPVMFPEEFSSCGENGTTPQQHGRAGYKAKATAAAPLGDAAGWRTNEGDGWTVEEDAALRSVRLSSANHQPVSWKAVARAVGGGRTAKQCRERWGGLQPWTTEEDDRLITLYDDLGPAWSQIVQQCGFQDRSKRHIRVRVATLLHERDESAAAELELISAQTAQLREERAALEWAAVNRRRVRGKGWHVDIGPGFSTDWRRTVEGHCYQGCVVLVLLTDCGPGQGGTCFVSGSHCRVAEYLQSKRAGGGVPHQELNNWCIEQVVRAMSDGDLRYHRVGREALHPTATAADGSTASLHHKGTSDNSSVSEGPSQDAASGDSGGGWGVIEQVVGKAGDIVLLHPWCVHSGTTNLGTRPRIMLNGMVRTKNSGVVSSRLVRDTIASLNPRDYKQSPA